MAFETLLRQYDRILIFDTETTGLDCRRDEIIQFSGAVYSLRDGTAELTDTYDAFLQLSPGGFVPAYITELTGIRDADLRKNGRPRQDVCREIAGLMDSRTLLAAYNAQFDLSFLYYTLLRHGDPDILRMPDKLDALTIFRDRRPGSHTLAAAITAYRLGRKVKNSHRAAEDVAATAAVLEKMEAERPDLECYVNLFDASLRSSGIAVPGVTYRHRRTGVPLYHSCTNT